MESRRQLYRRCVITPLAVVEWMIECGWHPSNREAQAMLAYFDTMMRRERFIQIVQEDRLYAFVTFFIIPDLRALRTFHERSWWSTPADDPTGSTVYLDKMITARFTRPLLRQIEQVLTARFPQLTRAVWFRPGRDGAPDRRYRYTRRFNAHAERV